jgi:hypothetical protein
VIVVIALVRHGHDRMPPDIDDSLRRWVAAGLITAEQAEEIGWFERIPPPPPARSLRPERVEFSPASARRVGRPSLAEALGYVGGVFALVGVFLVVSRFWVDLALAARLAMTIPTAVVLGLAGWAVAARDERPAFLRLRAVLWTLSTAATALTAGLIVAETMGDDDGMAIAFAASLAAAVHAGALWAGRVRPLQQLACLATGLVALGTGIALVVEGPYGGFAVWAVALGLIAVGLLGRMMQRHLPVLVGVVGAVVGVGVVISHWPGVGLPLALATALGYLTLVEHPRMELSAVDRLVLLAAGLMLGLQALPSTLVYYAQDAGVATGLALWVAGAVLLVLGLRDVPATPGAVTAVGGLALVGGAALTASQWTAFALVLGLVTALALITIGAVVERTTVSAAGLLGLLINVPWAINWFFPGEGRVPLMLLAVGLLILGAAVVLARATRRRG